MACTASVVLSAHAAPTTAPVPSAIDADTDTAKTLRARRSADAADDTTADSRTLRMLLELQQAAPRDAATDPKAAPAARGDVASLRKQAAVAVAEMQSAQSAQTARREPSRAQAGSGDWQPLPGAPALDGSDRNSLQDGQAAGSAGVSGVQYDGTPSSSGAPPSSTRSAAHEDYSDARRIVPPGLVQFLRVNRDWILVSTLALVAGVWVIGAAARRRR